MMDSIPALTPSYQINGSGVGAVAFGNDDKLFVRFYARPMIDHAASIAAGYPIKKDVDHTIIRQPGEKDEYNQPTIREDQMRFPRQWALYKEGKDQEVIGAPISILFPDSPSVVENLRFLKIQTIEQLANLNDTQIQNIGMGGRMFYEKAKAFLAAAEKGKGFHELEEKNKLMADQMEAMKAQIEAMSKRFTEKGEVIPAAPVQKRKYTKRQVAEKVGE